MKLLTNGFKSNILSKFIDSFGTDHQDKYYMVIGKSLPYDDELIPDSTSDSVSYDYIIRENIIFGKEIDSSNVEYGIKNIKWVSGQVYDMYDDTTENLKDKKFYVVVEESGDFYTVFKCLGNNSGLPSTSRPKYVETSATDEYYKTADGYEWKYMFRISGTTYRKFASDDFIPLTIDQAVIDNAAAKPNSIEHIKVVDGGSNYNSYAFGYVNQSAIAGNPLIFSIKTDENIDLFTFEVDLTLGTNVDTAKKIYFKLSTGDNYTVGGTAVSNSVYYVNGSTVKTIATETRTIPRNISEIFQTADNLSSGTKIYTATVNSFRQDLLPNLSANTDFYKSSSFYIRSGTGAGQIKTITDYIVAGNDRRVVLDTEFSHMPDTTSRFEILPRVIIEGDGVGVNYSTPIAIPEIDTTSNTITHIEMLDTGKYFNYASARVLANTGFISITGDPVITSSASLRPIISPVGGHGSDPINELFSTTAIISNAFDGNENGKISTENDFRSISIMKDPRFQNVTISINNNALLFIDGEKIFNENKFSFGTVYSRNGNTLVLSDSTGHFFAGDVISSDRNGANQIATITNVSKSYDIFDNRIKLAIEMQNYGSDGTGFQNDDKVKQSGIENVIGFVHSHGASLINICKTTGLWTSSDDLSGFESQLINIRNGALAKITGVVLNDVAKNSGEILYTENVFPVARSDSQKETIRIYITI